MLATRSQAAPRPRTDLERLRLDHPIAELVEAYGIELRRAGSALVGRCPFHADYGRPNLTIYPRSGRFVCFRCQVRGDAIAFVEQIEHISFLEAVHRLDARPGFNPTAETRSQSPRSARATRPRKPQGLTAAERAALSAATELYRNRLLVDDTALAYLAGRGFTRETVERAQLGYATGAELRPYLEWRGIAPAIAGRCGLIEPAGGERLAGRIVFPEFRQGQPIWLVGRLLSPDEDLPKYLGLPGTKPLLGWEAATRDLRTVCLVEGPLDQLALSQWGVPVLALCGTWISDTCLRQLDQWARFYTILDADSAGQDATARLVEAFGTRVVQVHLPVNVNDPADLAVLADGQTVLQTAIREAALAYGTLPDTLPD